MDRAGPLLAASGFLLARASQHPSIVAITVAIVAVRAFSVGRGVFRYAERLTSHDAAFRTLADVRVAIYRRIERLAPAGLRTFRSGELVARFVSDVDGTQDLFIRGIAPPVTAALVGAGAVTASLRRRGDSPGQSERSGRVAHPARAEVRHGQRPRHRPDGGRLRPGLEPETRRAITADLLAVTAGRSTLLITHDLDCLDQVDEIVVLDAGRVAERGTHADLLRAAGLYRQLWEARQSRQNAARTSWPSPA